ncbi:MAG TPA: GNAT family N-acetyltransferase [Thermoanaerobaculia bacterium]|nr:GNAT family N-acetyltransferase [Thermoanaerobaculia bacterium]
MVSLAFEGRWSIRALGDDEVKAAVAFLKRDPLMNVYLISRLLEERSAAATQIFAVKHNRGIVMLASLATNIVLATDPAEKPDIVDGATAMIAERIISRMLPVRAIISPAPLVEKLWARLRTRVDPPTVVRMNQPVYAIRRRFEFPELTHSRYATVADLDQLVPACAAMHKEEVGIDPLERDAVGYRERIRELVEHHRSIVRYDGRMIAAKCEFSAVSDEAVQLMGVWTNPQDRRHGFAREMLREVCGHLFRRGKNVTLFVNDFNLPAIALYESIGFQRIGVNRALIW